jgi:acyl-CoA reductase-like NAD-dependent aldehyde dehydrogenase
VTVSMAKPRRDAHRAAVPSYSLVIGNVEKAALSGASFTRVDPFDGSIAAEFANADANDAEAAITVARRAFDDGPWPRLPARGRYDVLMKAARLIESRADAFADSMVRESGKPLRLARGEVQGAIKTFEYYAGQVLALEGSAISDRVPDAIGLILREPIGVAALITPWNFPLLNPVCKLAPALAAGNTVVAKPSHLCPGPVVLLAQCLIEAGLPAGVFNVLTSDIERGAVVGQALAQSDMVDKVAFTGSTNTGRAVMRAAAANNKKLSLELGGKSANIVFDDAPFDLAAEISISAFCFNSGQQCSAGSRLLLQRGIYDRFLEALVHRAGKQVLGDPLRAETTMGPLVNEEQFQRVSSYFKVGLEEGTLLTGGKTLDGVAGTGSLFFSPTIFRDVANTSRLAQEEVFGPLLAVIPFDTESDAIRLANENRYGLAGGVWTRDLSTAMRVVKGVRTGKMFVNAYNSAGIDDMPHGGCKDSGIGREFGREGLAEYQEIKTVQIKLI